MDSKLHVTELERAVRVAIAGGLEPHMVAEVVKNLTDLYERYSHPALIAGDDLASGFLD